MYPTCIPNFEIFTPVYVPKVIKDKTDASSLATEFINKRRFRRRHIMNHKLPICHYPGLSDQGKPRDEFEKEAEARFANHHNKNNRKDDLQTSSRKVFLKYSEIGNYLSKLSHFRIIKFVDRLLDCYSSHSDKLKFETSVVEILNQVFDNLKFSQQKLYDDKRLKNISETHNKSMMDFLDFKEPEDALVSFVGSSDDRKKIEETVITPRECWVKIMHKMKTFCEKNDYRTLLRNFLEMTAAKKAMFEKSAESCDSGSHKSG